MAKEWSNWAGDQRCLPARMEAPAGRAELVLAERYPRWQEFQALRARFDPDGRFRNEYTDRVLGPTSQSGGAYASSSP